MKLSIDTSFVIQVAAQTDIELAEARQRTPAGRYLARAAPPLPMHLSLAEVEAVLTALHVLGHYTPPLWQDGEVNP